MVPPGGCTCKEGYNPNYENTPDICKDYDNTGMDWCYVDNQPSCLAKKHGNHGFWARCERNGAYRVIL